VKDGVGAAKGRVAELRALLRYLFVQGLTPLALPAAVPPVAGWHDTGIPPTLSAEDVQALLEGCDCSASTGGAGLRHVDAARPGWDCVRPRWRASH
jgi:hypothetical protein